MHPQCHPQTKLWTVRQLDLGTRWPPAGPVSSLSPPPPRAQQPCFWPLSPPPSWPQGVSPGPAALSRANHTRLQGRNQKKTPGPISPNFPLIFNFFLFFPKSFFITDFRKPRPWRFTQQVLAKTKVFFLIGLEEVGATAPRCTKGSPPHPHLPPPSAITQLWSRGGMKRIPARPQTGVLIFT